MDIPPAKPRIGIIGNMNNAGFAIMRYFRDLGANAYLLPLATDGVGGAAHFAPEADTWDMERWRPYIRELPFANDRSALLGAPLRLRPAPSRQRIRRELAGYDRLVGSGVAPALLARAGMRLDIFYPYGVGVEFYGDHLFLARMNSSRLRKLSHGRIRSLQASGIRAARYCLNAELSETRNSLNEIGRAFLPVGLPAVYNRESERPDLLSPQVRDAIRRIKGAQLSVFSSARHHWVRDPTIPDHHWPSYTKNSDWLIRGFKAFLDRRPKVDALLTFTEYGKDVDASKRLIASLGLENKVQWLPVTPRREIMALLAASDIGVGQFYTDPGVLWGGTGWEVLASGRPMLHRLNFSADRFRDDYGHAAPDILDVSAPEDIAGHLEAMLADPERRARMGLAAKQWFERHGGIGLAERWLELLGPDA